MAKYDRSGLSKTGKLDPLRGVAAGIMHIAALGGGDTSKFRKMGDDLYQSMKTGKPQGNWTIDGVKGGGKDDGGKDDGGKDDGGKGDGDNDTVKKVRPTFNDVDFNMKGEFRKKPIYIGKKPDLLMKPTGTEVQMKSGGLVRGAGKAERGRGRGKMI